MSVGPVTKVLLATFADTGNDVTVRRIVGRLWVQSDQAGVAELQVGAFGVQIVNATAAALGVTAIQGPFTDEDSDLWMAHGYIQQSSSIDLAGPMGYAYAFESRAMRKLELGATIAIMVENANASTDFTVSIGLAILVSH